jgi:hypothetical protein
MGIERSSGIPVQAGGVTYGMAGGGWSGVTAELDEVVQQAAEALAAAYGKDIEIRFNSDRHSGGAFLRTPGGRNDEVGIGASVITSHTRESWENAVRRYDAEANGEFALLTSEQREGARENAAAYRRSLANYPEGLLTVYAHIRGRAVRDSLQAAELVKLGYWNDMGSADYRDGYHHDDAASVNDALARCLWFVPQSRPADAAAGEARITTGHAAKTGIRFSPQGFILIGDEPDPLEGVPMNEAAAKVLRDAGLLDD